MSRLIYMCVASHVHTFLAIEYVQHEFKELKIFNIKEPWSETLHKTAWKPWTYYPKIATITGRQWGDTIETFKILNGTLDMKGIKKEQLYGKPLRQHLPITASIMAAQYR